MKKLKKRTPQMNSVEAYQCTCAVENCGCPGCTCKGDYSGTWGVFETGMATNMYYSVNQILIN